MYIHIYACKYRPSANLTLEHPPFVDAFSIGKSEGLSRAVRISDDCVELPILKSLNDNLRVVLVDTPYS